MKNPSETVTNPNAGPERSANSLQCWQVQGIHEAIRDLDAGRWIDDREVLARVERWADSIPARRPEARD